MLGVKNVLGLILLLCCCSWAAVAQERPPDIPLLPPPKIVPVPPTIYDISEIKVRAGSPSLIGALRQIAQVDTVGDIKTTVLYEAEDSIRIEVKRNLAKFYDKGDLKYGPIELKADYIEFDWQKNLLYAEGVPDTTGRVRKKPLFKEGIDTYETNTLKYSFASGKAYITGAVTQQGDSYLQAKEIKKTQSGELYTYFGRFTTCNLEHPHFYIQSEQIKAIPGNKLVSGPFHIRFSDIPTPIGLPFGMFPDQKKKRSSGIIFPNYGEERVRGFFIRDGGYYLALNDYVHFSVLGELYSKGGWGGTILSQYNKRYSYTGNFRFNYSRFASDLTEIRPVNINDFWVEWSHRPEARGDSRFSASVRAGTSTYNRNNTLNFQNNVNSEFASSVQYQKTFGGTPFNMSANLRHSQNVRDGRVQLTLPEAALNMNRQSPFQNMQFELLRQLNVTWNFNVTSRITNANLGRTPGGINNLVNRGERIAPDSIVPFNFQTLAFLFRNAQIGGRHQIPIQTSFNVLNHINATASYNYEELWYLQRLRYTWDADQNGVRLDTIPGFNRAGTYNAAFALTTRLYGTYNVNGKKTEAIRHMVVPTIGFNYRPDYSDPKYGFFMPVQVNQNGQIQNFSVFEGFAYGAPQAGRQGAIAFSIENNIEAKKRVARDTTGKTEKVKIIDNLSISSGYNLLADSFALAPIQTALRTTILDRKVNVNFTTQIDPYVNVLDSVSQGRIFQRRLDQFAWNNGQGIGRLTNVAVNLNTNLNSKAQAAGRQGGTAGGPQGVGMPGGPLGMDGLGDMAAAGNVQAQLMMANPWNYVDFTIPWNVNIGYNLNYNRQGFNDPNITQALTVQGSLALTEKWQFQVQTGYDFNTKELTHTTININRDLHCWELRVNWVPFGRFTSYMVDLQVKPGMLQDLKLSRRRNLNDR